MYHLTTHKQIFNCFCPPCSDSSDCSPCSEPLALSLLSSLELPVPLQSSSDDVTSYRHTAGFLLTGCGAPAKQSPSSSLQSQRPRIPMGKEAGRSQEIVICFIDITIDIIEYYLLWSKWKLLAVWSSWMYLVHKYVTNGFHVFGPVSGFSLQYPWPCGLGLSHEKEENQKKHDNEKTKLRCWYSLWCSGMFLDDMFFWVFKLEQH